jgi:hypothetical protein
MTNRAATYTSGYTTGLPGSKTTSFWTPICTVKGKGFWNFTLRYFFFWITRGIGVQNDDVLDPGNPVVYPEVFTVAFLNE